MNSLFKNSAITSLVAFPLISAAEQLEVTSVNKLPFARSSQTLEISAADLAPLKAKNFNLIHVKGVDFYSAGMSRGCGGSGLWADDRLWVSRNFISSHVLAKADATDEATYWAGFCRDKAGLYQDAVAWKAHVAEFAQGLGSPLEIKTALSNDP